MFFFISPIFCGKIVNDQDANKIIFDVTAAPSYISGS